MKMFGPPAEGGGLEMKMNKGGDRIAPFVSDSFSLLPQAVSGTDLPKHRVMLVGDSNTMPLYGEQVRMILSQVFAEVSVFTFRAGEEHKNLESIEQLLLELMERRFDRSDCIAALGGGVTGDMAGFAAAIYLRGIPVIQLPTSLLAQIDSSIGGKTGIDFKGYKNMVGAFHMPALVYTNTSALKTLPDEQFTSGMGEVIKSALLADAGFFNWLLERQDEILKRDRDTLYEMIRRTAGIKTEIVRRDPTEKGERALLNLGHTVGHAVEKAKNFSMLHGDCVAVGLAAAVHISAERGLLSSEEVSSIRTACTVFGLPLSVRDLSAEEILHITKSDKKMASGQIRFILPDGIGKAFIAADVTDEELLSGIRSVLL